MHYIRVHELLIYESLFVLQVFIYCLYKDPCYVMLLIGAFIIIDDDLGCYMFFFLPSYVFTLAVVNANETEG